MKITKHFLNLLNQFNSNWSENQIRFCLKLTNQVIDNLENHPLEGEVTHLYNGQGGSLPYFGTESITWCTLAPNAQTLKKTVEQLRGWVIPSYGWVGNDDGYKVADHSSGGAFLSAISDNSASNYFRWKSSVKHLSIIEQKFAKRFQLEKLRPERTRQDRPSLYELRSQFQAALILGDRNLAEKVIRLIDTYELDKALNTQMMRIRLWHHFRDFDAIKEWHNLPGILACPVLPDVITGCLNDALGRVPSKKETVQKVAPATIIPSPVFDNDWNLWLKFVETENIESCRDWLANKEVVNVDSLSTDQIKSFADGWDALFINEDLIKQHRHLVGEGLVTFLGDFVREPSFPRPQFDELYMSLLQLWGEVNAGKGTGREEGHVLLELSNALLLLNYKVDEVKTIIEDWWKARPVTSQLPFALDAVELLAFEHPNEEAAGNLWIDAADKAKNNPQLLLEAEKVLWRSIGTRLGFDEETISNYFPIELEPKAVELLGAAELTRVAIVCMREQQSRNAAQEIQARTGAEIVTVSGKVASAATDQARTCDVVLFVWLATTHSVFRAFDGFDRQKLCYVQGTGSASIVRSLERWVVEQQN